MEAQESEPLREVPDSRLALVEDKTKTPWLQPLGKPRLDLPGLPPAVAERNHAIGVPDQDRAARYRFSSPSASMVTNSSGLLQSARRDAQEHGTDHAAPGSSLLGRREPLTWFEHPRFPPVGNHLPRGEVPEGIQQPGVIDPIERRRQVRTQDPHALRVLTAQGADRGLDRVTAATTCPEPTRPGLEPGLPLGFPRVPGPCLAAPVHEHGNPQFTQPAVRPSAHTRSNRTLQESP